MKVEGIEYERTNIAVKVLILFLIDKDNFGVRLQLHIGRI
jgi:hypothetical protein